MSFIDNAPHRESHDFHGDNPLGADPLGWGFPFTFDPILFAGSTSVGAINRGHINRVYGGGRITKLRLWVGVQSGNISAGVMRGSYGMNPPTTIIGGVGLTAGRAPTDGVTTSGSPTVTSATAAFVASDVGKAISGTNIPASSYIGVVNSATSIGLSSVPNANTPVNATGTGSAITLTIATGVACPPVNSQDLVLPSPINVDGRTDFLYVAADNTTATFGRVSASASDTPFGTGRSYRGEGLVGTSAMPALTAANRVGLIVIGVP